MIDPRRISVILVAYEMERELPRTLRSLSHGYQLGVSADDYEVIVVDNGSSIPIDRDAVSRWGANFRLLRIEEPSPSPVGAMNRGVAASRGSIVGLHIDGARLATPGLLQYVKLAFSIYEDPTVATLSWHLGPAPQQESISEGYSREVEDDLLARIDWPNNGYRLFEISSLAPSSESGFFLPIHESNSFFLKRAGYDSIGGFDEVFDLPGGGLANLDCYRRALERPGSRLVMLLGEGSFHQLHGGISTNVPVSEGAQRFARWADQYRQLRGEPWQPAGVAPVFLGAAPDGCLEAIQWSAARAIEERR